MYFFFSENIVQIHIYFFLQKLINEHQPNTPSQGQLDQQVQDAAAYVCCVRIHGQHTSIERCRFCTYMHALPETVRNEICRGHSQIHNHRYILPAKKKDTYISKSLKKKKTSAAKSEVLKNQLRFCFLFYPQLLRCHVAIKFCTHLDSLSIFGAKKKSNFLYLVFNFRFIAGAVESKKATLEGEFCCKNKRRHGGELQVKACRFSKLGMGCEDLCAISTLAMHNQHLKITSGYS